ncbi:MAG TPA: pilus assembly protein TadG-related protein [Longimicrobiales bacterium]|nr:pilus assembly protein TadG-related protein [Longimicrobiales bacterium]
MRRQVRAYWSDRRGSAVALVAVSLTALVSLLALGIDVGMLFNARSEAQRAADSSALAGASAFLDYPAEEAPEPAEQRALEYAVQNHIRKEIITESEVAVSVNVDSATVTVFIRRTGVPTWFARLLGRDEVPIGAQATAQASDAGTAQCLKPFAVPDMWQETSDDRNGNQIWDEGERWNFDPGVDRYEGYSGPGGTGGETGYGSAWRDPYSDVEGNRYTRDYGRRIMIKATDPHMSFVPSFFYPWVLPPDPGQPDCGEERDGTELLNGNGRGAAAYRRNICTCNASVIDLETEYEIEPGNMVGPTFQGVSLLIQQDRNAYWDEGDHRVVSDFGDDSPRVITVALFDPAEIEKGGRQSIRFNNFARFFIEEQASPQDPVTGRFMYYVAATGATSDSGTRTGSLVKRLRLIR